VQVQPGAQQACEGGRTQGREGENEMRLGNAGARQNSINLPQEKGKERGREGGKKKDFAGLPKGLRMALTLVVMVVERFMPMALVGVEAAKPPRLSLREEGVCREAARGV